MADPLSSPAAVVLGKREQKAVLPFSMSEWGDPDESKYSVKLQNMMGSMAQYNGTSTVPRHNVLLRAAVTAGLCVSPTPTDNKTMAEGLVVKRRGSLKSYEVELGAKCSCVVTNRQLGLHEKECVRTACNRSRWDFSC